MNTLHISMYHYTRDLPHSRYPNIKGLDLPVFRQQIDFLKHHFHIVTMEQVMDAVAGRSELPNRALLLTFDDGYADHYAFAFPVLEEFGVQGSFFIPGKTFSSHRLLDVNKIHYILASADIRELVQDVKKEMERYRTDYEFPPTDELFQQYAVANRFDSKETIFVKRMLQTALPEKLRGVIASNLFEKYVGISEEKLAYELYLTEGQIRTMRRHGMFIGIHGYDHYWLADLPKEKMKEDIADALEALDEFIDRKRWVMNYPYGSYDAGILEYVASQGACVGLTTEARVADLSRDCALALPRLDCNDFPPKSDNYLRLGGNA